MGRSLSANDKAILERLCMAASGFSDDHWRDVDMRDVARTDISDHVFECGLSRLQEAGLYIPADEHRSRVRDMAFENLAA